MLACIFDMKKVKGTDKGFNLYARAFRYQFSKSNDQKERLMLHVMLTLDLSQAEPERNDFYKHLLELGWEKFSDVDTVWRREFPGRPTDDTTACGTAGDIGEELTAAAERFRPKQISYVAQIGNHPAYARVVRNETKRYAVYEA